MITTVSSPAPPFSTSTPAPPTITSLPLLPVMLSLPAPPSISAMFSSCVPERSSTEPAVATAAITLRPPPPSIVSTVFAPLKL